MEEIFNRVFNTFKEDADKIEIWVEHKHSVKFEKRKDYPLFKKESKFEEITVRWLNEKGLCGISYTTSLEEDKLISAVLRAKFLSNKGLPEAYPPIKEYSYPEIKPVKLQLVSEEQAKQELFAIEDFVLSLPKIEEIEKLSLSYGSYKYALYRKDKVLFWEEPFYTFLISMVAKENGNRASAWEWVNSVEFLGVDELKEKLSQAGKRAVYLARGKKGKSLKTKVLLPPFVATEFLEVLSFALSGEEVIKGRSFLKGKLRQKVFSEKITIVDDGILEKGIESRPFDDEGIPQSRKVLIEKGELKGYLSTYFWKEIAKKRGEEGFFIGCARRSGIGSGPKVGLTNFFVCKGNTKKQELINQDEVLEILEVLGMHTVDPISGNFSIGVSGVLYSKGEPVKYFKELALSGNIFELFQKVIEIGEDFEFYGNLGSPSILVDKMDLGGR